MKKVLTLTEGQKKAFEGLSKFLNEGSGYAVLSGHAGTGKTFLTGLLLENMKKRALVTSPTHKALKVLKSVAPSSIMYTFRTLHSALGMQAQIDRSGKQVFKVMPGKMDIPVDSVGVLIVDEMSMIDDVLFQEIDERVDRGLLRVLFIGDSLQIPPVNHEHSIPCSPEGVERYRMKVYTLDEVVRQAKGNPIISYATEIRSNIESDLTIEVSDSNVPGVGIVKEVDSLDLLDTLLEEWFTSTDEDADRYKVIAWTNNMVNSLNNKIRYMRYGEDSLHRVVVGELLIADEPILTPTGSVVFNTNDEMSVERLSEDTLRINDGAFSIRYYDASVKCLNTGNIKNIRIVHEDSMDDYKNVLENLKEVAKGYPYGSIKAKKAWIDFYKFKEKFAQIKYNYAITAHKSQGSTYNTAMVIASDISRNSKIKERNRIMYTACTRPSTNLYMVF